MASRLIPDNALTKRAKQWKKDQGIVSLTFDELQDKIKGKKLIAEQKIDGQTAIMEYKNGNARFGSLGGRIITDIPVLDEIESVLKKQGIERALMVGELAAMEKGKVLPFNESESIIKNPAKEKDNLYWFPYQLLASNNDRFTEDFLTYSEGWDVLQGLFKGAKLIRPVKSTTNLKEAWDTYVEKQDNEGLVVRTEDGKVYKSKPVFTYDLVIIAVGDKKGKNWPKRMIGNTLMAFMDEDKVFRAAGEIGTGFSDETREELYDWAHKNKVDEDDTYVWVKPEKIAEVKWERSNIMKNNAYKYENGKYEKVGKLPVGTIVKPVFLRFREDKDVNPDDLRLTQIPNWDERKKMAHRIIAKWEEYMKKTAGYPDNPEEIVISKKESILDNEVKEIDVWTYYEGIKGKLIPLLKEKDLFIVIKPDGKPIYKRHPYDGKTEYIRINDTKDFEEYHSGRTVEYHVTMEASTKLYIVDFDPSEEMDFDKAKKIAGEVYDGLINLLEVKKVDIRYTGKRGFHILGHLKEEQPVEQAHDDLEKWLNENFNDRDDIVIQESPKGKKGALGISPMKHNGGHVALHSMRVSGLCCMEIPRSRLSKFNREEALPEKVYKRLTGKEFSPKIKEKSARRILRAYLEKVSDYDHSKLKSGYSGRFVIQQHWATNYHWDLRLEFPVESVSSALKEYGDNNIPKGVPKGKGQSGSGTVYRSWAVPKHEIPTKGNKVYVVPTEDHPISYGSFEGEIPEGHYGAGTVKIYDKGTFELLERDADKKYVVDFKGNKLKGQYAFVKYRDGYLWVKADNNKKASTIDYVWPTMHAGVWDLETYPPKLKPEVKKELLSLLNIEPKKIKKLYVSGSITSYNYRRDGDFDVDIIYNPDYVTPEEADKIQKQLDKKRDNNVGGTELTYSFMVLEPGDFPKADGVYDIYEDRWVRGPYKIPTDFDPDKAFVQEKHFALEVIKDIYAIISEIEIAVTDLDHVNSHLSQGSRYYAKKIILLARIKNLCMRLVNIRRFVWNLHKASLEEKPIYLVHNYSRSWDLRYIIFKYIARYGGHEPVQLLYFIVQDKPLVDLLKKMMPEDAVGRLTKD